MGEMKDKVQGKAREVKGGVTGDTGEELKGKAQQAKGNVEGAMNDAGAQARADADRADADADRAAADARTRRVNP
jgi:uncharacterized protein YjbJ (UPF0337 family)